MNQIVADKSSNSLLRNNVYTASLNSSTKAMHKKVNKLMKSKEQKKGAVFLNDVTKSQESFISQEELRKTCQT